MTIQTQRPSRQNQSMECFRLLASFLVVFAHIHFPGTIGQVINCLGRCAVPGFLAISGFFSYGADSHKLGRRIKSMLVLILTAFGLELFWNCFLIELEGGSSIGYLRAMIPTPRELLEFFYLCLNPLRDSLWYLPAALEALCVLWVYVRFFGADPVDYRPLYIVSLCLFIGNLTMGILGNLAESPASFFLTRNGLYFGLPLFAMGIFLRQYWQRITDNFGLNRRKLVLLILGCLVLSVVEWFNVDLCDVLVGSNLAVFFAMLLMAKYPHVTARPMPGRIIAAFGGISTAIYVVHSLFIDVYERFLQQPLSAATAAEPWLRPLVVLAFSLLTGILWQQASTLWKKNRRK